MDPHQPPILSPPPHLCIITFDPSHDNPPSLVQTVTSIEDLLGVTINDVLLVGYWQVILGVM